MLANLTKDPVKLAIGVVIVGGAAYLLIRQAAKDVGAAAGAAAGAVAGAADDVWSGNTGWNRGTPYEGTGVIGTVGGAVNRGVPILDDIGGWIGRSIYDLFHDDYEPNTPPITEDQDEGSWWQFWK
ncbi:MAG: hypothetical protein M3Y79_11980 [Pseudomonadota bacterium]|nr:hypothetical protein [Pseudomonadota bacterium]